MDYHVLNEEIERWLEMMLEKREEEFSLYRVAGRYHNFMNVCHSVSRLVRMEMGVFSSSFVPVYDEGVLRVFWCGSEVGCIYKENGEVVTRYGENLSRAGFSIRSMEMYLREYYRECEELEECESITSIPLGSNVSGEFDYNGFVYVVKKVLVNGKYLTVRIAASSDGMKGLVYRSGEKYYLVEKEKMARLMKRIKVNQRKLPVYLGWYYEDLMGYYEVVGPVLDGCQKVNFETPINIEINEEEPYKRVIVDSDDFFEVVGGVKAIRSYYLDNRVLRRVDLSCLSFKNVDIRGVDFRGTNFYPNIQTVWNKDASGCNFTNLAMPFVDLQGCVMDNCILMGTYANLLGVKSARGIVVDESVALVDNCVVEEVERPYTFSLKID